MSHYPLIVKRQIKGSSIWEKPERGNSVSLFPVLPECIRAKQEKGRCFVLVCNPGRRFACPGLFSGRPSRDSGGESGERRAKSGERRGVGNGRVTVVKHWVMITSNDAVSRSTGRCRKKGDVHSWSVTPDDAALVRGCSAQKVRGGPRLEMDPWGSSR